LLRCLFAWLTDRLGLPARPAQPVRVPARQRLRLDFQSPWPLRALGPLLLAGGQFERGGRVRVYLQQAGQAATGRPWLLVARFDASQAATAWAPQVHLQFSGEDGRPPPTGVRRFALMVVVDGQPGAAFRFTPVLTGFDTGGGFVALTGRPGALVDLDPMDGRAGTEPSLPRDSRQAA
jgi:hypothetical protein